MKITLDIDRILDRIYAASAISASMRMRDASSREPLLTADHRHALIRIAVMAAASTNSISDLSSHMTSISMPEIGTDSSANISFDIDLRKEADVEALIAQLENTIALKTLALVAAASGDEACRALYDDMSLDSATALAEILSAPSTMTSRLNWL